MSGDEPKLKAGAVANGEAVGSDSFKTMAFRVHEALDAGDHIEARTRSDALIGAFPTRPQGAMLKARTLVAQQRIEEALVVLREALRAHESNPKLLSLTRNVAFQHGGLEEALEYALRLSEIAPPDRKNQAFLIQAYLASKDSVSAERHADAMVEIFPNEPQAVMLKAQILLARQDLGEVLRLSGEWLRVNQADPRVVRLAKSVAFQHGKTDEAIGYARLLLDSGPTDRKNHVFIVRSYLSLGDFASALSEAETLSAAFPNEPDGPLVKAQAQVALHLIDEALATLKKALETFQADPKLLGLARNIASQNGRLDEAIGYARLLLESMPADHKNHVFIVRSYLSLGDFASALSEAETLSAAFPNEQDGPLLKAQAQLALHRPEEALATLKKALETFQADPKLLGLARNIASQNGRLDEAIGFALKLLDIAPGDYKNHVFIVQSYLSLGDFASALIQAERFGDAFPNEPDGPMLKAQARVAQFQVEDSLQGLRDALAALGDDLKLLGLARNIAFQNGRFEEASDYGRRLSEIAPGDDKNKVVLGQSYMAAGEFDTADQYLRKINSPTASSVVKKIALHFQQYKQLKDSAPPLVAAWEAALGNSGDERAPATAGAGAATMIQYWSQGTPPADVGLIVSRWKGLMEREGLGQVELFDRSSAEAWMSEHAPEFEDHFAKAFHYAMESDIFRIAYASKRPSIYMDIDSWPLENSAEILRYGISSSKSLLYFRSHRPWLVNGFFISRPDCPFFVELAAQCLAIDLDVLPRNHRTIETTFGPTRYNKVLLDHINERADLKASRIANVHGCSTLSFDDYEIDFTHEAAVASVKPPFPLGYKGTDDHWKGTSISD